MQNSLIKPKVPTHTFYAPKQPILGTSHGNKIHFATKQYIARGGRYTFIPLCWNFNVGDSFTLDIEKCTCTTCLRTILNILCKNKAKGDLEDEKRDDSDGIHS